METENRKLERIAGLVIIAGSIASFTALSLDRTGTASETRALFRELVAFGPGRELVHAVQMICITGYAFGFSVLSMRLGLRRGTVLAGLITFLFGIAMMFIATVNDGFLSFAVANRFAEAPDADLEIARDLLRFVNLAVVYFGDIAFALMGAGTAFWSFGLARQGRLGAATALVGLIGGVATIGALAWQPVLDMGTLLGIVGGEFCFNLLAGILLLRGPAATAEASGEAMRLSRAA